MLKTAVETGLEMEKRGYSARVLSMHTLKPLDVAAVFQAAKETGRIATIEEHSSGGLGTAVAEVLAEVNQAFRFTSFAISMPVFSVTGSQSYLRSQAGLTVGQITESLIQKFFMKSQG
jgi:transketolase